MTEQIQINALTAGQERMLEVWQRHVIAEFVVPDPEAALETMTEDACVLNVPAFTGGFGKEAVRDFYTNHFIPQIPAGMETIPLSQTVGTDRIVEESVARFTHNIRMDWLLPGLEPTGRQIEIAVVGVIHFREGKIASEHLYWDQAAVLVQLGLLEGPGVSLVGGLASARALVDPGPAHNAALKARYSGT